MWTASEIPSKLLIHFRRHNQDIRKTEIFVMSDVPSSRTDTNRAFAISFHSVYYLLLLPGHFISSKMNPGTQFSLIEYLVQLCDQQCTAETLHISLYLRTSQTRHEHKRQLCFNKADIYPPGQYFPVPSNHSIADWNVDSVLLIRM
jgi:hypothetical protein